MFLANTGKINESDECACGDESRLLSGIQAQEIRIVVISKWLLMC